MASKEEILVYIQMLSRKNIITKDELNDAFEAGCDIKTDIVLIRKLGIVEILYYIGGAIVFLGISILVSQNWSTLNFGTKILATLGVGIITYYIGILFSKVERTETVGSAFYLISALVMPIGLYVVFNEAGVDTGSFGFQTLISGILFGMYFLSYLIFRKNIFTLFSILFGTWLFFSFTSFIIGNGPYSIDWKFFEYRALVIGICYILLGYDFSKNERSPLKDFLYGFGIFSFLGAAFLLGGWKPTQNIFWELLYPGLVFGTLFLSVQIKSKAFLTWGTFFLMVYILKITSEYFSEGLGWSLVLVITGFGMIGISYMSLSFKKKYLSG